MDRDVEQFPDVADGYILKIDSDEANTIIRIFRLFGEQGYSAKRSVNVLNRELKETGSPKSPRGEYWCVSTILGSKKAFRGILNNEIYIGRYRWNRSISRRNPENGKKKTIAKEQSKWFLIDKPELRIVSDELWDKVKKRQNQLNNANNGKYNKARPAHFTNLITGLVTCGQCGGNIVVVSGGKWAKYGCSNNWNKGSAVCGNNIKVVKKDIEKALVNALGIKFDDDGCIAYLTEKVNIIVKASLAENSAEWRGDALAEQFKKINKEIANFINAIKAGIITDTVKNQLFNAEKKGKEIEGLLSDAKEEAPVAPSVSGDIISGYIADMHATLSLHPIHGRTLLSRIIEKVFVEPCEDMARISVYCKQDGILEGKYFVTDVGASRSAAKTCDFDLPAPNKLAA